MQLEHVFASGSLVQTVDVLRDDGGQLARPLQLRQLAVRRVGLCVQSEHFVLIKTVKFLRLRHKERMTEDGLRRIIIFLIVQTVDTAEVRDSAFRRHARTAEKDNPV